MEASRFKWKIAENMSVYRGNNSHRPAVINNSNYYYRAGKHCERCVWFWVSLTKAVSCDTGIKVTLYTETRWNVNVNICLGLLIWLRSIISIVVSRLSSHFGVYSGVWYIRNKKIRSTVMQLWLNIHVINYLWICFSFKAQNENGFVSF